MKKRCFIVLVLVLMACGGLSAQTPLGYFHTFDTVTDADSCYLFYLPKPCFFPNTYQTAPGRVLLQEYVVTDTVTVYGVALTFWNKLNNPIYNNSTFIQARLMTMLGPSTYPNHYTMQPIDTVTLNRSHPRFCWFMYKSDSECPVKDTMIASCYELYFDTPAQINRMTDTFYVGLERFASNYFLPGYFCGQYDISLPGHMYTAPGSESPFPGNDYFSYRNYDASDRMWGIAFPIIGFRCGPVKQYWLDEYMSHNAMVKWRNAEEGTLYNLRLVGEDGSDTTIVTSDTVAVLSNLSDSVRYNVMLRKQCHYATSNYDTTVYSEWATSLYFGTTILDTVWRTVTVAGNPPYMGLVSGGGVYEDSSTVTLSATPFDGFAFDGWNDGDNDNPRQVLVVSDTAFTALFREVEDTVGIRQAVDEDFTLQPNPASGTVQILLPTSVHGGRLSLCDLAGRELEAHTVNGTTMALNIGTLAAGAYVVRLQTSRGVAEKKLVKK